MSDLQAMTTQRMVRELMQALRPDLSDSGAVLENPPLEARYEAIVAGYLERVRENWREVVFDLVLHFGYRGFTKKHRRTVFTGGLSCLEDAFEALGWDDDPQDITEFTIGCDEPGCGDWITCGTPTEGGYRSTCSKHVPGRVAAPPRPEGQ